ncbi:FecCD family ABC transporter permease [Patulibacter defluvii]|uniref:FecCD family ABC transporter permease n=1 Tax=Patulibacter defluvii TaxID=3095358 RepID=UPI002A74BDAA|nr:iron chelate uptake ABC transporter family permease subunit [Patulibacter sp. DM4]
MSTAEAPIPGPPAGLGRIVRVPLVGASLRVAPRTVAVCAALAVIALVALVLSIGTGEYPIAPGRVVETLLGGGDQGTQFVIETLRLPRALTALLVGAALGAGGAILQSISRNPLGSPDIVGFTQGASAGAVLQIVVLGGGAAATATASIIGGLAAAIVVYALSYRGGVAGYRLVLVGIGMAALMAAITDYLITRARLEDAQAAWVWITGSLNGRGWEHVRPVALALVVLLPLVVVLARDLRMMEMGDDAAKALGVKVERSRLLLVLVAVGLTAVATASAGPVIFVGLAAPQIGRRLTRATGPGVGTAALTGAVLLLLADLGGQRIFPSHQLPVGVMTGVLGGAYLIWLLSNEWRSRRA